MKNHYLYYFLPSLFLTGLLIFVLLNPNISLVILVTFLLILMMVTLIMAAKKIQQEIQRKMNMNRKVIVPVEVIRNSRLKLQNFED